MRGHNDPQVRLLAITADQFVPADHPIRQIKVIVDAALQELDPTLASRYSKVEVVPSLLALLVAMLAAYEASRRRRDT